MKTTVSTPEAPAAIGTYSQAVKIPATASLVYLSGQIPLEPNSMQLVQGFESQVKQVFENLKAVCAAAGGSLNDVIKFNVYLTDLGQFAKVNEVMATYVSAPYPARAAVGVSALPRGAEVEIEAVMALSDQAG
jgi:reactive intermediate/imine deaminase